MTERREQLRFALEARQPVGVAGEEIEQHVDGWFEESKERVPVK